VLYRWERKVLHWLEALGHRTRRDLGAAQALQASLPDSLAAYKVLLAAALLTDDAAKARAVLLHPCAQRPRSVARHRMVAGVDLRRARPARRSGGRVPAEFDALLGDLERVQQDPADASYLRGVRTWVGSDANRRRRETA
jgi:hypothetical protein